MIEKGYDEKYGARPLKRTIQNLLEDQLAEAVLEGTVREGDTVDVTVLGRPAEIFRRPSTNRWKNARSVWYNDRTAVITTFDLQDAVRKHKRRLSIMPVINELIRAEENGTISFGNYMLDVKSKAEDFEHDGDLYKVKTFKDITKLERNGMFVYESVPGTAVNDFSVSDTDVTFRVEGTEDAQITVQLEDDMEYEVFEDGVAVGGMVTNMSGKLSLSVELSEGKSVEVRIVRK